MKYKSIVSIFVASMSSAYADNLTWFSDSQMTFDKSAQENNGEKRPANIETPNPSKVANSGVEASIVPEKKDQIGARNEAHGIRFSVGEYGAELISIAPMSESASKGISPNECKDLFAAEFRPDANLRKAILKEMQFPLEANAALPEKLRWIFGGHKGCFSRNTKTSSPNLENLDAALRRLIPSK